MPPRKVPPTEVLRDLYAGGLSAREIATKLNLNQNTIASALRRFGIVNRAPSETMRMQKERGAERSVTKYWLGKKQPPEMVEKRVSKIRGENHYLWKGGKHRRVYRNLINKKRCANCDTNDNLGIHHKDFDHYNDDLSNLEVLCNSCHMSLHKTEYWNAKREGRDPRKSNCPVGWGVEKGGDRLVNSRRCGEDTVTE